MFSTVFPTLHDVTIGVNYEAAMVDTLGFISGFTEITAEAFRPTIEAILLSDYVIHVVGENYFTECLTERILDFVVLDPEKLLRVKIGKADEDEYDFIIRVDQDWAKFDDYLENLLSISRFRFCQKKRRT